jgi:hypothetical protein
LSPFRFRVVGQPLSERRVGNRRQSEEGQAPHAPRSVSRSIFLAAVLITLSLLGWQWRLVAYAPVWLIRANRADHSDLYTGSTNGISNRTLVEQARNYLSDIDHVDASGNLTVPEALRPLGVHLAMSWFRHHAPDSLEFNPFKGPKGAFTVSWNYVPGCQEALWASAGSDTDWYSLRGRPCYPICRLSIVMAPDLRLTSMALNPL